MVNTLTLKQEQFCRNYVSGEFFGNATRAYKDAYGVDYDSAKAAAWLLLTNINIQKRVTQLLELEGLSDTYVDKQLIFVLWQFDDLSSKMRAVAEYNKMKGRYAPDKISVEWEVTINNKRLEKLDEITKSVLS